MSRICAAVFVLAFLTTAVAAQSAPPAEKPTNEVGWTSSIEFDGSANSQERVLDLDSSVGYNFDKHWGVAMGVPFSFVSSAAPSSTTTPSQTGKNASTSLNSAGNIHVDVNFRANGNAANYSSTLTAGAPTGSAAHGVSTGRPNFGWNNHVEHAFNRLTPFVEAGFSNGLTDTRLYHRPYSTLGFISQFTGGSMIDLGRNFSVGASLYEVLPAGPQKMFSKLVSKGSSSTAGTGKYGRSYELAAETTGDAALTRDNGGSAWVEFSPDKIFDLQMGYTHSVHLALDTFTFSLGVNLRNLAKAGNRQ